MKLLPATSCLIQKENKKVNNFVISGGERSQRCRFLYSVIGHIANTQPIIVVSAHCNDKRLLNQFSSFFHPKNIWCCCGDDDGFEPFFQMQPNVFMTVMRQMFEECNYNWKASTELVIDVHLKILKKLNSSLSLSALYYLCCTPKVHELSALRMLIMNLAAEDDEKNQMWADLDVDNNAEEINNFRSVIRKFSEEAQFSGWKYGNIGNKNIITASSHQGKPLLYLTIDNDFSSLMQIYLACELKSTKHLNFSLFIEEVSLSKCLAEMIWTSDSYYQSGVIGENVPSMLSVRSNADEANNVEVYQWLERVQSFVIFHHNTGPACNTWSNIIGKNDQTKVTSSSGSAQKFLSIFPDHSHQGYSYTNENRYRVMPEEIQGLTKTECIIFDAENNLIIR